MAGKRCYVATKERLIRIADGWNNQADVKLFHNLQEDRLWDYRHGGYTVEWTGQESLELAADRLSKVKIGLPTMIVTFPILTNAEVQLLRTLGPQVTVRAYNYDEAEWNYYNATMFPPDKPTTLDNSIYEYNDYALNYIDLKVL